MVGKLQRGESVVLEDGRVVHPEQVTDTMMCDDRSFLSTYRCLYRRNKCSKTEYRNYAYIVLIVSIYIFKKLNPRS